MKLKKYLGSLLIVVPLGFTISCGELPGDKSSEDKLINEKSSEDKSLKDKLIKGEPSEGKLSKDKLIKGEPSEGKLSKDKLINENSSEELSKHLYFVDKNIQDSKERKHIVLNNVERNDVELFTSNINSYFRSKIVFGGFSEIRHFYNNSKHFVNVHSGIDVFMKENTKIISPIDGKVISSYWVRKREYPKMTGLGGVTFIEAKIKDLDINNSLKEFIYLKKGDKYYKQPKFAHMLNGKYIEPKPENLATKEEYEKYINNLDDAKRKIQLEDESNILLSFTHLSKRSANIFGRIKNITNDRSHLININKDVDWEHKKDIQKGDIIGYVGNTVENGGWAPHVHLEVYSYMPVYSYFSRARQYNVHQSNINNKWWKNKSMGTHGLWSKSQIEKYSTSEANWDYFSSHGLFSPNALYNLYDENTDKVYLK